MSYKYLYGFTNEPSYDLSKVIYFGQQDRRGINLTRVVEHYRANDPNHLELSAAKYVIFCQVSTRDSLPDLEAYFIQTYKPHCNCIYNTDKNGAPKLDDAQLADIRLDADCLVWNLIKNDKSSVLSMNWVLSEINKQNDIIQNAAVTFKDRQALTRMKCLDIASAVKGRTGVIMPLIRNSLIHPMTLVTATDEYIELKPYSNHRFISKETDTEIIQYQTIFQGFQLPELDIYVNDIISETREYLTSDLIATGDLEETKNEIYRMWTRAVYLFVKKLLLLEPRFISQMALGNLMLPFDDLCDYNGGFKSTNWHVIKCLQILIHRDISYPQERTLHIEEFIEDENSINDLILATAEELIAKYQAKSPEEVTEDARLLSYTEIPDWLEGIEENVAC